MCVRGEELDEAPRGALTGSSDHQRQIQVGLAVRMILALCSSLRLFRSSDSYRGYFALTNKPLTQINSLLVW